MLYIKFKSLLYVIESFDCKVLIITDCVWKNNPFFEYFFGNCAIFKINNFNQLHFTNFCQKYENKNIKIIIHTAGGDNDVTNFISVALRDHPNTSAYIPYYAYSGGSLIALACKKIFMNTASSMGPIDSQVEYGFVDSDYLYSSTSIIEYHDYCEKNKVVMPADKYIKYLDAKKIYDYDKYFIRSVFKTNRDNNLIDFFCNGRYPHDVSFSFSELHGLDPYLFRKFGPTDINCQCLIDILLEQI